MVDEDLRSRLRALGIPGDAVEHALARGDPEGAVFDPVLMPTIAKRTVSAAEIERAGGLSVEEIDATISAFGLPPPAPDEPAFTPEEAAAYKQLGELRATDGHRRSRSSCRGYMAGTYPGWPRRRSSSSACTSSPACGQTPTIDSSPSMRCRARSRACTRWPAR